MKTYFRFFVWSSFLVLLGLLTGSATREVLGQSFPEATTLVTTFTYQGYLEENAIPVTGTCDMQFSLFDDLGAGSQIGSTLSINNVVVNGGVFNVQLDFGAGIFNGQDRYLSVSVRCPAGTGAYTPLIPRQPITPVPAAIFSSSGGGGGGDGWSLTGNAGTNPALQFIGTTDNQAFEVRVNSARALRVEPNATSPTLIGGFSGNSVTAGASGGVVAGGGQTAAPNLVTDAFGVVVGGQNNQAGDNGGSATDRVGAAVVGGSANRAQGFESFIGGGQGNIAAGIRGVIVGGTSNSVAGAASAIGGGSGNTAGGDYATIPGGRNNITSAAYTFAAGRRAQADDVGAFVWGDSTDATVASPGSNTFTVRAAGGIWLGTTSSAVMGAGEFISTSTGASLTSGGVWTNSSDRNLKENFSIVDTQQVLDALMALPVTTWNYTAESDSIRRIGPMAQDFYAAFGLGANDITISTIDAQGVAFASIQGLYNIVQEQSAQINSQQDAIADLQAQNAELEARLSTLEGLAGSSHSAAALPFAVVLVGGLAFALLKRSGR